MVSIEKKINNSFILEYLDSFFELSFGYKRLSTWKRITAGPFTPNTVPTGKEVLNHIINDFIPKWEKAFSYKKDKPLPYFRIVNFYTNKVVWLKVDGKVVVSFK